MISLRQTARPCSSSCWAVLLVGLLVLCLPSSGSAAWPWKQKPLPDISSGAKCRAASKGHVYKGDSIHPALQSWFKVNGPPVQLPKNMTDITTAATIIQLAVPDLKLVLDPLLYLKAAPKPKGIPKVIHMTMKSKHSLAPHVLLSIISWGWYNRGYALLLYDNRDINAYMREFYPGFVPTYNQLKTAVEKSDAWRYHVLCGHGGVYADTDTICGKPFESWTQFDTSPEPGLIVGIENLFHSQQAAEEASYVHKIQVTQWAMAAKKSHPVVCRMGAAIKDFIEHEGATGNSIEEKHGHDAAILLRTGPGVWSKEVHKYIRQMGSTPEDVTAGAQVEDLVVLPQAAFGCNFRYWHKDNNESFVYHMFNNSWKVDHYKVSDAKKQSRLERERRAAMQWRRVLYPGLFLASLVGGLLLARYSGWCGVVSNWLVIRVNTRRNSRKRRPYALAATSSPYGSPKVGSPKHGSPAGSPKGSSGSSSSVQNGRASFTQQRQSALHIMTSGSSSTRKSARLHD